MIDRIKFFKTSFKTSLGKIGFREDLIIDTMLGIDNRWMIKDHKDPKKIQLMGFAFIGLNKDNFGKGVAIDYIYCDTYEEALDRLKINNQDFKRTQIDVQNYIDQKYVSRKEKIKKFLDENQ